MKELLFALAIGLAGGAALAKLPPPSPEEQAQAERMKEEKKAQTEKEKKSLEQAEDRVARQYRATHPAWGKPYEGRKAKPQGQAHSSD